jgi:hypothetical protein
MSQRHGLLSSLGVVLLILFLVIGFRSSPAQTGAPAVDVVQINLDPLINTAAKDRNRFAVDIPHVIDASPAGMGSWSVTRGVATWRYSVRLPTAVSLSFHAALLGCEQCGSAGRQCDSPDRNHRQSGAERLDLRTGQCGDGHTLYPQLANRRRNVL